MTLRFADRISETTSTTGAGTYTLAGAKAGYKAFSTACSDADTCYYVATDGTNYEIGLGTFTLSGTTLARTTILNNSAGDTNPISWGSGTKDIFLDAPATLFTNGIPFSGSAATPGIPTSLSNTTGIYSDTLNTLGLSIAGTNRLYIDATGKVGISNTSPSQALHVIGGALISNNIAIGGATYNSSYGLNLSQDAANASKIGIMIDSDVSGTLSADRTNYGLYNLLTSSADNTSFDNNLYSNYNKITNTNGYGYNEAYAAYNSVRNEDTSKTNASTSGSYNTVENTGAGTLTYAYGTTNIVQNSGTGTIGSANGLYNATTNTNGTTNIAYSNYNYVLQSGSGTTTTAYGNYNRVRNLSGTITTGYLYYGKLEGTIGTKYGIYLEGETTNYLSGNVGIGTTSPSTALDVNGTITATTYTGALASAVTATTQTVGTNNTTVASTAFSQSVTQNYCYGFVNKFRNPSMDIWQRGASGTIVAGSPSYTADGWVVSSTGANISWSQQGFGFGHYYYLKLTGATSVSNTQIYQRIESSVAAQLNGGNNVTVQAIIYNNTGGDITPTLTISHANSLDNWSAKTVDVNAVTLQTINNGNFTVVAYTYTPASATYNGLEIIFDLGASLNSGTKIIGFMKADIRVTPSATVGLNSNPPLPELRQIGTELLLCQRYYYRVTPDSGDTFGLGQVFGANGATIQIPFPVQMRVIPTALEQSGTASHYRMWNASGSSQDCTSVPTLSSITSQTIGGAIFTSTTLSGTAGQVTTSIGTGSGYLGWSAEL